MATKKEKEAKAEKAKRLEAINVVCGQIEQAHGKGTIQRMGDSPSFRDQPIISTGSLGLDVALGIGGYPRGRMVEIFGPESCIDGGSFIQYNVRTKEGRRMNHKGGTIQRLWERFHGKPVSGNRQGKYLRPVSIGAKFTAPCMNEEGGIFHNEILDVMNTGIKQCFEIFTLGGYSIIATGDHKFFTGEKWVALRDLEAGETLTVHNNTPFQKDPQEEPVRRTKERSYWYVKNHPVAGVKKVTASLSRENRSLKKDYFYKRLSASRGIVEAAKNGITVEEYKERLNSEDLEGLVFLDREDHVHHIDEDHTNDSFANLMVIKASEHGRLHAMKRHNDLRFTVIEDVISSIVPVGEKQTFDLRMESPFNNFIADNFVVHNSGKTTLTLHAIAEVQRSGGFAAFIDVEHALDPEYAEKIGVNPKDIYLSQPDNAEQALEVVESLICSKAFDLVVVDSVAALVPKAEVEGDMGQSHMGLQARLMSQACRKLAGLCSTTNTTLFWINQIRHKIGVMFGCFQYNARVVLADGRTEKIGKIVNNKMDVEVLSFDKETGECRKRKVIDWHNNGNAEQFLQFVVERSGGSGTSRFGVTPNHKIFTPNGEVSAGDLDVGDEVLGKGLFQLNHSQMQIALGSVLGDGSLRKTGRHTTQLRIGHGAQQLDYARWKAETFGDALRWSGSTGTDGWGFDLRPSCDLIEVEKESYHHTIGLEGCELTSRTLSQKLVDEIDFPGVAIWYMDDACFSGSYAKWGHGKVEISIKSYALGEMEKFFSIFAKLELPMPTLTKKGTLLWSGERTHTLQTKLAPYIHPCMSYKIHPKLKVGQFVEDFFDPRIKERFKMIPVRITDIYTKPPTRSMRKFDLTVEGDHCYIVDGVGVHNSPEVTTGGNALKFYASVRLDIRRIGSEKEGDKVIANKTRVKVVKNKVSPPFKQAEFAIQFNVGIARHLEVLDLGVEHELLQKNGAFYSFEESTIGQGRMKAGKWLLDHPEILDDLCTKLKTILLPPLSVGKKRPAIPSQKTPVEAPKKEKKPTKGTSKKKAGLPSKSLPTP